MCLFAREMDKNSLEWLFGATVRMHHNYMHSFMRNCGLTEVTHPRLLFIVDALEQQGQDLAQCELAQKLGVSAASIAVSLKRMEKGGLVERQMAENDNRRNVIRLTDKGRKLLDRCRHTVRQSEQGLFAGFSPEEREQLAGYFKRIIANMEDMGATAPGFLPKF